MSRAGMLGLTGEKVNMIPIYRNGTLGLRAALTNYEAVWYI